MRPDLFMVFDVESVGLHGEGFAVGWVVVNRLGDTLSKGLACCPSSMCYGTNENRAWVAENVPAMSVTHDLPPAMRDEFWRAWQRWKAAGAVLVADCAWPVEAKFLHQCVNDNPAQREWGGPYPLHELATVLLMLGRDPLGTTERLPSELPAHHPLNDARQSARQLIEALTAKE